jgi:hypothetical protein
MMKRRYDERSDHATGLPLIHLLDENVMLVIFSFLDEAGFKKASVRAIQRDATKKFT